MSSSELIVATHSGSFHLDDLMAVSLVQLLHPDHQVGWVRTRDQSIIDNADWVVDVGGEYDHQRRRYDHHQPGRPQRDNGIPYAAFGLLWRHWGIELCGSKKVADKIDVEFIQMLDGPDNGVRTTESLYENGSVPALSMLTWLWSANWDEDEDSDERFAELLVFVKQILSKLINKYVSKESAYALFDQAYHLASDKQVVMVQSGIGPESPDMYPEVLYLVYQNPVDDTWKAKCITSEGFACKLAFPESWRGLSGSDLQAVSDVDEAEFVHKAGFLAVASSKAGILSMCNKSIDQL